MALTKETGEIVSGANTYVDASDLNAYLAERGISFNGNAGNRDAVLIKAMDFLEAQAFVGFKQTKDQPLQWPRSDVYIDGHFYQQGEMPPLLLKAQLEIAIAIDSGNDPSATLGRETKREKVGDIEVEYMPSARESAELVAVNNILKKIAAPTSSRASSVFIDRI